MKQLNNKYILEAIQRGINLALDNFEDQNSDIQVQSYGKIKDINSASSYMNLLVDRILQIPISSPYNIEKEIRQTLKKEYKTLLEFYNNNKSKYIAYTREDLKELIKRIVIIDKDADLNWIDTSHITNMMTLFGDFGTYEFCGDISSWDTSNVTNMWQMFYRCGKFNCDISNWNTSKVKNMSMMFNCCTHFNQPIGKWNVSNVTDMGSMFGGCRNFNQDLSKWNTHNVKSMRNMFIRCVKFNQDISMWDVSNVEDNDCFAEKSGLLKYTQKLPHFNIYKTKEYILKTLGVI